MGVMLKKGEDMKRFHVLSALACFSFLTAFSMPVVAEDRKDDSIKPDTQAPVITVKTEDDVIQIIQGNEFDLKKYVVVSDNSNEFHLMSYGEVDTDKAATYQLKLVAIDGGGNTANAELTVKVITQAEMDAQIAEEKARLEEQERALQRERLAQKAKEEAAMNMQAEISSGADGSAYDFAQNYIGMSGWCTQVAQAFIDGYFGSGYNIYDNYAVSAAEAQPGDLIYYSESGQGTQHWAVYLGGESALHGNFNGTTVIRSIYLNGGSEPTFLRLNGR